MYVLSMECVTQFMLQCPLSLPQGYTVPAGHLMMLSPYWSHRDAEKFPDPENYNPVTPGMG